MPLDDFFAKKEKKKPKRKQNPQELIEKLTKEAEKVKELDGETTSEIVKTGVTLGKDEEWEALEEDEKDIEVQNIRIGNLELSPVEDLAKPTSKEKDDKEKNVEREDKKVWALKVAEPKDEEEDKQENPPEPEAPKKYIPISLRQGGASVHAPKPNVSSAADFPTLDAACTPGVTGKGKPAGSGAMREDDSNGWSQAGASQRPNRSQDMMPCAISSNPSAYVPPALRSGGALPYTPTSRYDYRSDNRSYRPRESMSHRFDGHSSGQRFDGFQHKENITSTFDGWSRGATISTPQSFNTGYHGGPSFTSKNLSPSRFGQVNVENTTDNSGWTRSVNMKTFREPVREKTEFELVQTNRFAGLEES